MTHHKVSKLRSTSPAPDDIQPEERELLTYVDRSRDEDALHAEIRALREEVRQLRLQRDTEEVQDPSTSTLHKFWHRAGWLVVLLAFQSTSSLILERFDLLVQRHPMIIYFLTMLVGAGGNAGGQTTVLVVRQLAIGQMKGENTEATSALQLIVEQIWVGIRLGVVLFLACFVRCFLFDVEWSESVAICASMVAIVCSSTLIGAALPNMLKWADMDPAHAGAAIQVVMDITGVSLTCLIACLILGVPLSGDGAENGHHVSKPIILGSIRHGTHTLGYGTVGTMEAFGQLHQQAHVIVTDD